MNSDSVFRYCYSAKQNEEVRAIRDKYLPRSESKLEELRRLDHCVHSAGMAQSLAIGLAGCIIFGLGMCFAMQVIGESVALGAFIGMWGVTAMAAAYPVYRAFVRRARAKHRHRILELAAELCGENNEKENRKETS